MGETKLDEEDTGSEVMRNHRARVHRKTAQKNVAGRKEKPGSKEET